MAKRRPLTGTPLLVASATVVLAVGCGGALGETAVVGNLMPPPPRSVCVDASPADAVVTIDGNVSAERCVDVESYWEHKVQVSAPGFATQTTVVPGEGSPEPVSLTIELVPEPTPPPPPVGNLMPPPRVPKPPVKPQ